MASGARIGATRRAVLLSAASVSALSFVRSAFAAERVVPTGQITLAWHTNIAPRWLDPLQHDGGATPDNFLNVVQDALIKNYKTQTYDHLALADRFDFAEDALRATFELRPGIHFHDGSPVTPEDVRWSYEHYHGAWAKVLHDLTDRITIADRRTIRFDFKKPFLDFPRLMGTATVRGAASRSGRGSTSSSPARASARAWANWYESHVQMRRPARRRCVLRQRSRSQIRAVSGLRQTRRAQGARRGHPAGTSSELLLRAGIPPRLHERDRSTHRRQEMAGCLSDTSPPATPIRGKTSRSRRDQKKRGHKGRKSCRTCC